MELIAVIELGGSHDECLLSQLHALKQKGKRLLLICNEEILLRHPEFNTYADDVLTIGKELIHHRKKVYKCVSEKLADECPSKVIFNTAQGNLVRDLCIRFLFSKMEFIGIIHTTLKLRNSFTQKVISKKIKKYLLLSRYLLDTVGGRTDCLDYFYPLRFAQFEQVQWKDHYPTIVIIGGVEKRRKDLDGFISMLEQLTPGTAEFVFLGKSDVEKEEVIDFQKKVTRGGFGDWVKWYDDFVPQKEFDNIMANATLILPLVHPDTGSADQYFKNQISGAMTVSFAYKVPMLIHGAYRTIEEMQPAAFYYQIDAFQEALSFALENRKARSEEMKQVREYDVEYQEQRYLDFVFSDQKNTSI